MPPSNQDIAEAKQFINELYQQRLEKFNKDLEFRNLVDRSVDQVMNCNALFELIQNADDAKLDDTPVKIKIILKQDTLIFSHNGKLFTEEDVRGIVRIAYGNKQNDLDSTGFMGIGFKSVYAFSDIVSVTSWPYTFDFNKKHIIKDASILEEAHPYWYAFPLWRDESDISKQEVHFKMHLEDHVKKPTVVGYIDAIINNPQILLFLNHVNRIEIMTDNNSITIIELTKEKKISTLYGDYEKIKILVNGKASHWQLWSNKITFKLSDFTREELHPKYKMLKNQQEANFNLQIAVPVQSTWRLENLDKNIKGSVVDFSNPIFCTLPTQHACNLSFLLNGLFSLDLTRDHVHVNKWNTLLFKEAGTLYSHIFLNVFKENDDFTKLTLPAELANQFHMAFLNAVQVKLKTAHWLPCRDGKLRTVDQTKFDLVGILEWMQDQETCENVNVHFGKNADDYFDAKLDLQHKLYSVLKGRLNINISAYQREMLISDLKKINSFINFIGKSEKINQSFVENLAKYYHSYEKGMQTDKELKDVAFVLCRINTQHVLKKPSESYCQPVAEVQTVDLIQAFPLIPYETQLTQLAKSWLGNHGVSQLDNVVIINAILTVLDNTQDKDNSKKVTHLFCERYGRIATSERSKLKQPYSVCVWTNRGNQPANLTYFPEHKIDLFVVNNLIYIDLTTDELHNWVREGLQYLGVKALTHNDVFNDFMRNFNEYTLEQKAEGLNWILINQTEIFKDRFFSMGINDLINNVKPQKILLPNITNENCLSHTCYLNADNIPVDSIDQYIPINFISAQFVALLNDGYEKILFSLGVINLNYKYIVTKILEFVCNRSASSGVTIILTQWLYDNADAILKDYHLESLLAVFGYHMLGNIYFVTTKNEMALVNTLYLSDIYEPEQSLEKYNVPIDFLSSAYVRPGDDKEKWKQFFIKMGVAQNITSMSRQSYQINANDLVSKEFTGYLQMLADWAVINRMAYKIARNVEYIPFIDRIINNINSVALYNIFWGFVKSNIQILFNETITVDSKAVPEKKLPTTHFPSYLLYLVWTYPCIMEEKSERLIKTSEIYTPRIQVIIKPFVALGVLTLYQLIDVSALLFLDAHFVKLGFQDELCEQDVTAVTHKIILQVDSGNELSAEFIDHCMKFYLYLKSMKQYNARAESILQKLQPVFSKLGYAAKISELLLKKLSVISELDQKKLVAMLDNMQFTDSEVRNQPRLSSQICDTDELIANYKIKQAGREGEEKAFAMLKNYYEKKDNSHLVDTETGFSCSYSKKKNKEHVKLSLEWTDKNTNQGLPYDIVITKNDKVDYCDVKSTVETAAAPFYLSKNQWFFMFKNPDNFHILRIEKPRSDPKLFKLSRLHKQIETLNVEKIEYEKGGKVVIQPTEESLKLKI